MFDVFVSILPFIIFGIIILGAVFMPLIRRKKLQGTYTAGWLFRVYLLTSLIAYVLIGGLLIYSDSTSHGEWSGFLTWIVLLVGHIAIFLALFLFAYLPAYFYAKSGLKNTFVSLLVIIGGLFILYILTGLVLNATCVFGRKASCMTGKVFDYNNPNICEWASEPDKCYLGIGSPLASMEICNRIKDNNIRYDCIDRQASSSRDKKLCDLIPPKNSLTNDAGGYRGREGCYARVEWCQTHEGCY